MDNSYGSFGAALGGGGFLAQAMSRRGYDAGILNQSSMDSRNPNANLMPQPTRQTNNALPPQQGMMAPQAPQAPQPALPAQAPQQPSMLPTTPPPASSYPVMPQVAQPQANPETPLIVAALIDRLKHHSSVEKDKLKLGNY